jgi:hypothetical protein
MVLAYVEIGVAMASESGVAAWSYEPSLWGRCGQGADEAAALTALTSGPVTVAERVVGDERAFGPDRRPATGAQREATLAILTRARAETIALVAGTPAEILDRDDPARTLPSFAGWRTLRQLAWHLVDTESRYYLPSLGLPARPRLPDLLDELAASGEHVRRAVATIPPDLVTDAAETWTTTNLLRRLAWHEPTELTTMHALARSSP